MSEWDGIEGLEAWNRKLRELLDEAGRSAKLDDQNARFAMSERLTQFVENSFPNNDKMRALDDIAAQAAIGLLEQNIDDRLKKIVARNAELAQLTKRFDASADELKASAAQIRLERARKTLDALNDGVATMKDLRSTLETVIDRELIASIDKAMAATQLVRNLLEKA